MTNPTPAPTPRTPKLCQHPDGRYYVRIRGKFHYLGKDTPEAQRRYFGLMAEITATGLAEPLKAQPADLTLAEACALYLEHAKKYYARGDGSEGSQVSRIQAVLLCAVDLFGPEPVSDFSPLRLRAVQTGLITRNYCRRNINSMTGCLKLAFKWLASHELVPAPVALALSVVPGLRAGKTEARESEPVKPVPEAHITAAREKLPPTIRAMVDLQLASGARPGEILELRPCDIDRSGPVWIAALDKHKTAHRGKSRALYFGPRAQAVLRPFLFNRGPADYLFSPREAVQQRYAECPTHRRPDQKPEAAKTDRTLRACFDVASYRRAITRACQKANADLSERGLPTIAPWHPHQLRHNFATAVRKRFGLEAAQVLLGHATADVTEIYAEVDREKAVDIALQIG